MSEDIEKLEKELSEAQYQLRLAIDQYYTPLYSCRDSDIEYFLKLADSKVDPYRNKINSIRFKLEKMMSEKLKKSDLFLEIQARVRYWEDSEVNGKKDTYGNLIPCRSGNFWCPTINIETGQIQDWPEKTTAKIHYKVCDEGEYRIVKDGNMVAKWNGFYVPDRILAIGEHGYGDYIILEINEDGIIKDWKKPELNKEDWCFI